MAKEIDDDVPIYFAGDDVHEEDVDPKALLEDQAPLDKEWSRYQPAKTLEQAAEEAVKRGEPKIKGLRNRATRAASLEVEERERHGKIETAQGDGDQSSTMQNLQNFLSKSGRFLTNSPAPKSAHESSDKESAQAQPALNESQTTIIRGQARNNRVWLLLTCVNVFFAGLWCGSFLFPNNRVVTMLRDTDAGEGAAGPTHSSGDRSIADAVSKLNPVVVNIDIRPGRLEPNQVMAPYKPMQKFFQPSPYNHGRVQIPGQLRHGMPVHAQASGIIISREGHILTNNHVIPPDTEIRVTLYDKREFQAKLVGRDAYSDLAVIKIPGSNYPMARFADSKKVRTGDWVIAMGSPYGFDHTVTAGLVSGLDRVVNEFSSNIPLIQTDAQISPGNSGGPLANTDGEVVGLVCAAGNSGKLGINWAIPSNVISEVARKLIEKGSVSRPFLGLFMDDVDPDRKKAQTLPIHSVMVIVSHVVRGGPADKANLCGNDIIESVNGRAVKSADEVRKILHDLKPGDTMKFRIRRMSPADGKLSTMEKTVQLENYPDNL